MPSLLSYLNDSKNISLIYGDMENILGMDEEQWITIHPYGFGQSEGADETKQYYRRICVETDTGEITKGLGAGQKVRDFFNQKPKQVKTDKERIEDFIRKRKNQPEEWLFRDIHKAAELELVKKHKPLERVLRTPEFRKELSAILLNKDFKDRRELKKFLRENYPAIHSKLDRYETAERFKMNTPSGRFFGPNGTNQTSGKYFIINHHPDENTVILEAPINRLRVVGKEDKRSLIFLTDKNKGIYINLEQNGLPVRNELNEVAIDTLCVKFNKDNLKTYTFSKEFDNTEKLKPLKKFEDFVKLAEKQDSLGIERTPYKNIKRDNLDTVNSYKNIMNAVSEHHRMQRNVNTVSIKDNSDLERHLKKNWNGKIYTYKNGDQAIFSGDDKIILTKEQATFIRNYYMN